MAVSAVYFDGEVARDHAVTLARVGSKLEFFGTDVPLTSWTIAGLHPIDPPTEGQPFRVTHDNKPGARLVIRDKAFIDDLVMQNSHLKGGYSWRHLGQVMGWTVAGLAGLGALLYITMTVLPQHLAGLLPQTWRKNMGEQVVESLVANAKKCETQGSNRAIASMLEALAEGGKELPPVTIEIYDMSITNAFAAPGSRIVLTQGLIDTATEPNEVTGVLAHELGHVYYLHPEAQLVRLSGLQILISAISGGAGGDLIPNTVGLAAILNYTRKAEREADQFARDVMAKARIDPIGLKTFFERMMAHKGIKPGDPVREPSALDRIGNVLSTHPGTQERIREIKPLPQGTLPRKVMDDATWQALKKACG